MPTAVRTVRITLFVLAAFTALVVIGALRILSMTAETLGALLWTALPGILALVLALQIPRGGTRRQFWLIIAVAILTLLAALTSLSNADPRGLTRLVLPIVLLVAVTRPAARRWFSTDPTDRAYQY